MASFIYNRGAELIATNDLDWDTATIKARLVMSNTTCDTELTKLTLSGFTTIDVCDGAAYAEATLANTTITRDDTNNRIELDADNVTWSTLGVGTRNSVGILIYQDLGGGDATSVPIAYIEFATAEVHDGSDFPIQWNVTYGIAYLDL
jgi:hypothetical protein